MTLENPLYPIFLDLRDQPVTVIGAGWVASRKVQSLVEAGARVRCISPQARPEVEDLAAKGCIEYHQRPYQPGDLRGARIAFCATDNREVNAAVFAEAREAGIFCNVADDPPHCDFHAPAVVERGPIKIAISTGGNSPLLAARLKQVIAEAVGPEWLVRAEFLAAVRRIVQSRFPEDIDRRRGLLERAMLLPLPPTLDEAAMTNCMKELGL